LLGEGFLERGSAALLAGPSGIGKSSIAMQMGCCWSCGRRAFDFVPPRPMRIIMMQNEDSPNDLVRQSEALRFLELDQELIRQNFWIETVRGKIGPDAVKVMDELVRWHRADLLFLNPISAYHDGDISQNKDNVKFLYGSIGKLLAEFRIGLFGIHHKGEPPKDKGKSHSEDVYFQVMYDILGGSVLTNFFRGIITVSPIGDSGIFRFTVAKHFEESGWPLHSTFYRWHEDRNRRLWVPASVAEVDGAKKASGKNLEDPQASAPSP
jgi:AAA domain